MNSLSESVVEIERLDNVNAIIRSYWLIAFHNSDIPYDIAGFEFVTPEDTVYDLEAMLACILGFDEAVTFVEGDDASE